MRVLLRRTWQVRDVAILTLLFVATAWTQRQPLADIVAIGFHDAEQSHIFLAPIVAAWLLWLRRSRLRLIQVQPSLLGPIVLALGWLIGWWGFTSGTQIAWHGGVLLTFTGVLISMAGLAPLVHFMPVALVMLFVLPVPGQLRHSIALPLQEFATTVTHALLELLGVSAIKSGNVLIINGEEVAVGEACNGMRMVFALTLVVFAFAFGTPLRNGSRIVLLILSPLIAMLCNVVRLVPTSLIFGYGTIDNAHRFHDAAGWVMLPVALMLLISVLRAIRWLEFPVTSYRLATQ